MSRRARFLRFGLVVAVIAGVAIWYFAGSSERPIPLVFDGNSDQLKQTVVVPTLDTPIPDGKNVIWCASFQYAWNHLKDDLAGEPIQLTNAQEVADQLNRAEQIENDMEADSVYATAGFAKDGIVERIQKEMARRFPDQPKPEIDVPEGGAVAYAYLVASSKFEYPFFDNDEPFLFKDSAGNETSVASFGIRPKDRSGYHSLRRQVQILYSGFVQEDGRDRLTEFVCDLCESSRPYQIVLARVDRKPTLAETLADIEKKVTESPPEGDGSKLGPNAVLLVPNMAWKVTHHFEEIEGRDKPFLDPSLRGLYLDAAIQTIQFRLDRSGAELTSEFRLVVRSSSHAYLANRPFLLYMKKRDARQPFLVLWIDNAELLVKK